LIASGAVQRTGILPPYYRRRKGLLFGTLFQNAKYLARRTFVIRNFVVFCFQLFHCKCWVLTWVRYSPWEESRVASTSRDRPKSATLQTMSSSTNIFLAARSWEEEKQGAFEAQTAATWSTQIEEVVLNRANLKHASHGFINV
jgi:hypothetical protein